MKIMKTLAATFLAVTVAAVMGVAAQDQTAPAEPAPSAPSAQEPAPAPAPDQTAPAQPAPDQAPASAAVTVSGCVAHEGDAFQLTDAKPAGDTKADVADAYTLVAGEGVNFAPHVGHQVELTGTSSAAGAGAPTLTVSALKMTAAKCQ